ncbi:deoxyribonuclease ii [Anaeramoeba flamelloides]|uniref:Deoxyribonuclease ii n=1 Tax=Anaeramoeba flamelloides TaxID=1746091 RepID=A0ABQ8YNS6_9EUKA|nr:deoxyribonuclease ii [Anaeramoeba flamelloides]|eukprot:Anaeramoba_flamelloidesc40807_g1_i2.p1 GENE.c40807_g1_i2~~c40807_g1_i2.p1  ORF type:complete len:357 (+),score=70.82 c40807_g1_i2:62-1132(+)
MNKPFTVIIIVLSVLIITSSATSISCRDENGSPVDWWIIYKYPTLSGADAGGYGYSYGDANSPKIVPTGKRLDHNLNGALGSTLKQTYGNLNSDNIGWVFYNDEVEGHSVSTSFAHAKGAVIWDSATAVWIVHSLPKFPPATDKAYSLPDSASDYGQVFMCNSMKYSDVDEIGLGLRYKYTHIYESNFPTKYKSPLSNMYKIINQEKISGSYSYTQVFSTIKGLTFKSFSKTSKWSTTTNTTLHEGLIGKSLGINAAWQTWMNGNGGKEPSFCPTSGYEYQCVNVNTVRITDQIQWKQTKDHAKWGITIEGDSKYVCIADINRMYSQMKRGGGSICFQHDQIHSSFSSFIGDRDSC